MKTLVSDFDKTIYPDKFILNVKAVNKFVDLNNNFIIATGRNFNSLLKEIKEQNINYSYLICNDGSVIYDKDHNLVRKIAINKNTLEKLLNYLSLYFKTIKLDNGVELTTNINDDIDGVFVLFDDINKAEEVVSYINQNFNDVHGYLSDNYINIVHIDASKGNAIKYLQSINNYEDIYVVGDGVNDVSMYEVYTGFSIKTSIEKLVKLAHYHVDSFLDVIIFLNKL